MIKISSKVNCLVAAGMLLLAGSSGRVRAQIPDGGERIPDGDTLTSAAFNRDGRLLAVGAYGIVRIFDAVNGRLLGTFGGHSGKVTSVAFSPDGRLLAAAGGEPGRKGDVRIWDVSFVKPQGLWAVKQSPTILEGPSDTVYAVAFSPDGRRLAAASYDHDVTVWELQGKGARGKAHGPGDKRHEAFIAGPYKIQIPNSKILRDHIDAVYALAFSPDGSLLATAAGDRTVKVWDPATGKRLYTFSESTAEVYAVAFSPDGVHLAAGGADKALRTYAVSRASGKLVKTAFAHKSAILRVAYAGRNALVTSGEDLLVKVWDSSTLQEKCVLPGQDDWPAALAVSPRGDLIAVGTHNHSLRLYDLTGHIVRRLLEGHPIAMAPTGNKVPMTSTIPGRRLGDQKQRRAPGTGAATLFQASLGAVNPVGMVRGKGIRLTLNGGLINDSMGVYFDDPAINGKIVAPKDSNGGVLRVDAMIGANTSIGVHRCWVQTPHGTTGSVTFAVGAWPEIAQIEPNNTPETAQPITVPCTVVGALDTPGDVDTFKFDACSGEELVFEVLVQPIRSRLQPVLAVMDESGKTLAESRAQIGRSDTVLGYRFERAGSYRVQLRDFEGAGGGDVHYRLNVGEFPLVTEAFPLGIQKGKTAEIAVKGFNLGGGGTVHVQAPGDAVWGQTMGLPLPGPYSISRTIAIGPDVELVAEAGNHTFDNAFVVPVPASINGRLSADQISARSDAWKSDHAHYYRFHARKGEPLTVEVQARRLGSPLDSEIEVLDSKGKRIERAVLRVMAQTDITFSDRDSASTGLRLTAWDSFHMSDYVLVGREVIRLDRLPKGPDEDVFFRSYRGQRLAYFGTTPEYHTIAAPVYRVEVLPAGSTFSPNGYPRSSLYYSNDDGGPHMGKDSRVDFVAPEDGDYVVRIRDTRGMEGSEFTYRLLIHPPRPDYKITMSPEQPNIPRGGGAVVTVECERYDGFDGPIDISLTGLPTGVTATTATIEAGETAATVLLTAAADAKTSSGSEPMRVSGKATIGGREVVRNIEPDNGVRLVTVLPSPDIKVATDISNVVIRPGEAVTVEAQVERQGKFGARVPIDVKNLPYGVFVQYVGLSGVLVTEQDDARKFSIYCEPWVKPQTRPFYVVGNVEGGTPNAAAALMLRVEAPSKKTAAQPEAKRRTKVSRR